MKLTSSGPAATVPSRDSENPDFKPRVGGAKGARPKGTWCEAIDNEA